MLKSLIIAAFAAQFTATSAHAALLDLATAPLADSTPTTVLPNLLFTMDDSGSMLQTYTPDYMSRWENFSSGHWGASNRTPGDNLEKNCKDSADDSDTDLDLCVPGDVPYMSPDLNSQYYNPAIQYIPGIKADGSSYESQTKANTANWTAVKSDGYGVTKRRLESTTSVATVNITSEIPDRLWCTTRSPTSNQRTNTATCRKNSDYLYPNATYKYGRNNSGAIVKDTGHGLTATRTTIPVNVPILQRNQT
jgi:type IV pilus assembly protein PilY1